MGDIAALNAGNLRRTLRDAPDRTDDSTKGPSGVDLYRWICTCARCAMWTAVRWRASWRRWRWYIGGIRARHVALAVPTHRWAAQVDEHQGS